MLPTKTQAGPRGSTLVRWLTLIAVMPVIVAPAPASAASAPAPVSASSAVALEQYFWIRSRTAGARCLDNDAGTQQNVRTNVQLYNCHFDVSAPNGDFTWQQWKFIGISGRPADEAKIQNWHGKCLTYNPNQNPTPVWTEACNRSGQGWRIWDRETANINGQLVSILSFVAVESPGTTNGKAGGLCLDSVDAAGPQQGGIDLWSCQSSGSYIRWYLMI